MYNVNNGPIKTFYNEGLMKQKIMTIILYTKINFELQF